MVPGATPSFFEGVPSDELEQILGRLERRSYPAGAVVIAEGETSHEIYITQSGAAEVFVADRQGLEHQVGRVGPGATLGEMSLFTGQPAVGTVRATDELEVLVLTESEFERVSSKFPRIYHTVGAILSDRLARTNRLAVREEPGRLTFLRDRGAPPLLGYALACSVAWHTRESTLLVVLDHEPSDELSALATIPMNLPRAPVHAAVGNGEPQLRAHLLIAPATSDIAANLEEMAQEYCETFEHVLVQIRDEVPPDPPASRTLLLTGPQEPGPAAVADGRFHTLAGWVEADGNGRDRDGVIRVPSLTPGDERALESGRLTADSGAGKVLGWAARDLAGLKIGLALGAGSVRGYAHFGVLGALARAGLSPDYVAGTSIGAIAAASYALGYSPLEGADLVDRAARKVIRPTFPSKSLLSSRAVRNFIRGETGETRIEDLQVPLAMVAADLVTRREVVFRRGLLWQAMVASFAIPGVFPAQRIGPYVLVDGGIIDPVPSRVAAAMGADIVIGVNLTHRPGEPDLEAEAVEAEGRPPSAVATMLGAMEIMQGTVRPQATNAANIVIAPDLPPLPPGRKLRNLQQGRRFLEAGEAATEAALPRIRAAFPWLRA